jgi:hypothetical protein
MIFFILKRRSDCPPLPEGEGRGEGVNRKLITSVN